MKAISIKTSVLLCSLFLSFIVFSDSPEKIKTSKQVNKKTISQFNAGNLAAAYRVIVFNNVGWSANEVERVIQESASIYKRECNFTFTSASIEFINVEKDFYHLNNSLQVQLLASLSDVKRPIVFFINETVEDDYAYAFLRGTTSSSQGTAWISRKSSQTCRGALLAHELGHIYIEQKVHSRDPDNLMFASCKSSNILNQSVGTTLTAQQCKNLYNNYLE